MKPINYQEIEAFKGDTIDIVLQIETEDGTPYEPEEGDIISFQMKERYESKRLFFQAKAYGPKKEIVIPSSVTALAKAPATYVFDVDILLKDGRKTTFVYGKVLFKNKVEGMNE